MIRRIQLFDFSFYSADSLTHVVDDVLNKQIMDEGKLPLMVTPNVDQIVKLARRENKELRNALETSQWILPDGQPVVTISKMIYGKQNGISVRLTGSAFFPLIWQKLKERNEKVVLVLPDQKLGHGFLKEHPPTRFYAPPYFNLRDKKAFEEVVSKIVKYFEGDRISYLFIGLGFPKQEKIALEVFRRLTEQNIPLPKTFLLGASFEFYLGTKKRAPMIYQKLGIEFVHRIISEPRRMIKRYLIDDLAFIPIAYREFRKKH